MGGLEPAEPYASYAPAFTKSSSYAYVHCLSCWHCTCSHFVLSVPKFYFNGTLAYYMDNKFCIMYACIKLMIKQSICRPLNTIASLNRAIGHDTAMAVPVFFVQPHAQTFKFRKRDINKARTCGQSPTPN